MSVPEMNELIERVVQDVAQKDFREYFDEYEEWIKKGVEGELFVWKYFNSSRFHVFFVIISENFIFLYYEFNNW